ncbi:sensor histidine kinase [Pseudoduganella namucuonensis]|uniref:histidine kinase n=1 Tax=Pseudoduganella namucuonensis TaxID=1035707 RepID=A0A1I7GUD8_9BURK|nr:response regulator [Pseudoduganella namucuonensis]SFU52035.1 His Kinase A (phospho-acceptor) domain-containing protein [Pseudoduganella namucuonensis]
MRAHAAIPIAAPEECPRGEILVVEDTPASLRLLSKLLTDAGYRVREAPSGELALWSAQAQAPDLVLLDIRMPGIDGYEVCGRLKRMPGLDEVPVIFLSAHSDMDDKLRGFEVGGVDFISKPFQFEEVNARVMAHLKIRRLQRQLAEHNDQLRRESRQRLAEIAHMNRNAGATVYCAALVHELNQPLAAIMSNAEAAELFMRMDPPALGDVEEILGDIKRDDRRASELIRRMRELLRKSDPVAQRVDLNEAVSQVRALLAGEARMRRVALEAETAPAALPVSADPVQLQQVLVNLVLNALDATEAVDAAAPRAVALRARRRGDGMAEVLVNDTGCGFGGDRERLFESFFTTKPQGMGLGLSIASAIVQAHGGRIWASDNPGGGATVGFSLPALGEGA